MLCIGHNFDMKTAPLQYESHKIQTYVLFILRVITKVERKVSYKIFIFYNTNRKIKCGREGIQGGRPL